MNSLLIFACIFVLLALSSSLTEAFGGGGTPGGWTVADVKDLSVIAAAQFAVEQQFQGSKPQFTIVKAMKQVVAGMNYDLTVNVRNGGSNACQVNHFQVYDRWGTRTLQLAEVVSKHC